MNLNEGEIICPKCDGTGNTKGNEFRFCDKCFGEGKLDWVSNVMGKIIPPSSPLNRLNVRRLVYYIRNTLDNMFVESASTNEALKVIMDSLVDRQAVYDYKIDNVDDKEVNLYLKPQRSAEIIKMNIEIKGE